VKVFIISSTEDQDVVKKWFFVRIRDTLMLKLILVWMEKIMGGEKIYGK